jgi:hypothetical protein
VAWRWVRARQATQPRHALSFAREPIRILFRDAVGTSRPGLRVSTPCHLHTSRLLSPLRLGVYVCVLRFTFVVLVWFQEVQLPRARNNFWQLMCKDTTNTLQQPLHPQPVHAHIISCIAVKLCATLRVCNPCAIGEALQSSAHFNQ